jgi:hypothetical protein
VIDFQLSPKRHLFGKYSYSNFLEDRGDWVYETARGLLVGGLVRKNISITFDHVYALNSTTIFNGSIAWNRFIEGSVSNAVQTSFPPSRAGPPSYLDQKAGDFIHLPGITFNAYNSLNRGYPGFTRYSVGTVRGEATKFIRTHSLRAGIDLRENWRAAFGPGQSAGSFSFNNSFVRQADVLGTMPALSSRTPVNHLHGYRSRQPFARRWGASGIGPSLRNVSL